MKADSHSKLNTGEQQRFDHQKMPPINTGQLSLQLTCVFIFLPVR